MEVVKLLVSHGADLMCKDKQGYTPLHAAAASGQLDMVKYLLRLAVEVKWLMMIIAVMHFIYSMFCEGQYFCMCLTFL